MKAAAQVSVARALCRRLRRCGLWVALAPAAVGCLTDAAFGQGPHPSLGGYFPQVDSAPGSIGAMQQFRKNPVYGHFQPVRFQGPEGLGVAVASEGRFQPLEAAPVMLALQVAPVYRLRVTNIPLHPGEEVFPTVELIDRTYPPPGLAWQHPVPIELSEEDLQLALSGKLVTRVIYIEDPEAALPRRDDPTRQRWFESAPGDNPIKVADTLGRPVAILRLGGRTPDADELADPRFYGHGAPFLRPQRPIAPEPQSLPEPNARRFPTTSPVGRLPQYPEPLHR